jgi:pimeloyl-ACP methyl ester carboxylesterase
VLPLMRPGWMLAVLVLVAGCGPRGNPAVAVPTAFVPAPQAAQRLVVVLPGRGDDLRALERSGIATAVQDAWPDADVMLAELAIGYYRAGIGPKRLHDDVIEPARARGYREIWLLGASMGGMGVLLYDLTYPGELDGLVLLAPYLGDRPILEEISAAGGVAPWNAGPPRELGADTFQRELWRHIQGWSRDPAKARNVWLAYGDSDRLRDAMPVLAPALRPVQILVREGGHAWSVWSPAAKEIFSRIESSRRQDTSGGGAP